MIKLCMIGLSLYSLYWLYGESPFGWEEALALMGIYSIGYLVGEFFENIKDMFRLHEKFGK